MLICAPTYANIGTVLHFVSRGVNRLRAMKKQPKLLTPPAPTAGVIFDQHYSDSLFRVALGRKGYRSRLSLGRSVAKKDVLLSLLLFDTAHVVTPFWLTEDAQGELNKLEAEGLISPIPSRPTLEAFRKVATFVDKCLELDAFHRAVPTYHYDTVTGRMENPNNAELDRYCSGTDLETDVALLHTQLCYIDPVIRASTRHLGDASLKVSDVMHLVNYLDNGLNRLDPESWDGLDIDPEYVFSDFLDKSLDILSSMNPADAVFQRDEAYGADLEVELDNDTETTIVSNAKRLRVALVALITATTCERYASSTQMPLRTAASTRGGGKVQAVENDAAYQLFKIQFESLRYPVLENLDDVRRLRGSSHLRSYRAVINEYSSRLRSEIADGKQSVLKSFKHDLELASADLKKLGRQTETFDNLSFYASFPLAVLGMICNLPIPIGIDNILLMPATIFWRSYAKNRAHELDWLLLGRS